LETHKCVGRDPSKFHAEQSAQDCATGHRIYGDRTGVFLKKIGAMKPKLETPNNEVTFSL